MVKEASRSTPRVTALVIGLLALLVAEPAVVGGQEKKNGLFHPWAATAEVSYVVTSGNTSTSALSLGTTFSRKWTNDTLLFRSYILTSHATTTTPIAQGTETDFTIIENKVTRQVAENYLLAAQYDRRVSKRLNGQAGLSWDRNRFAGVDDRVIVTTGFGYGWVGRPRTQVRTSAGLTYTIRQYVGQSAESFAGFRLTVSGDQKILDSSSVSTQFLFDDNLNRASDWRFDWANAVTASISKSFALKVILRTLYANVPALQSLALIDPFGDPTGLFVSVPLKKLDTFLTTSLVINF